MAIDLSRFADSFYEEATEHLVTMESLLLAVSTRRADEESLNAIFRAAHSIKGGAAAFGHVALGEFTHQLESAFDRIRKGALDLSKSLVGVFLRSVDALREHVIALRQGRTPDLAALETLGREITRSVATADRVRQALAEPIEVPAHHVEIALDAAPGASAAASASASAEADSLRINVARMDELVNLVGELVITQAMVSRARHSSGAALDDALAQLERTTRDMQRAVLAIRMLPIRHVTSRIPRLVRDVADRVGKDVDLVLEGEDTELDKGLIEKIADPLLHLVRNAIDHGIEPAQARAAAGKPARGRIVVRARHEGGKVVVCVADDGRGLDRAAIVAKARQSGISFNEDAADADLWPLIFRPGFSTAASVTEVSGRGVGMDVVLRNVSALGGSIDIASAAGHGATFTLRLPLTLAIIEGMSITAGGESYVVPLAAVAKSLRDEAAPRCIMGGRQVLAYGGEFIPVVGLATLFDPAASARAAGGVHVVLEADGRCAALHVDDLLGLHQTVVKGLEDNYRRIDGVSGATILGDGRVALILDAQRIVERAGGVSVRAS